jgi:PHD/YefM family antitoxin component YafN of YafNO toxin-antitoxin module
MPPITLHPQYIVDAANQKHSVILPLAEFEALMEDLEDLAAVAERREEPTISHDQLLAELKKTARR